jgi:hypothetical protein
LAVNFLQEDRLVQIGDLTVVLVDTQTGAIQRLLKPQNWAWSPSWDDDNWIYYVCRAASEQMLRLVRLCALDVQRRLSVVIQDFTSHLPEHGYISSLDVTHDGRVLIGFDDNSGDERIYVFDLAARHMVNVTAISGMRGSQLRWAARGRVLQPSRFTQP